MRVQIDLQEAEGVEGWGGTEEVEQRGVKVKRCKSVKVRRCKCRDNNKFTFSNY